jgi:hypothetical protein
MTSVARFSFRKNYTIFFDQLAAPTTAYIGRPDIEAWFDEAGLEGVHISHRHGISWRAMGTVGAEAGHERPASR